MAAEIYRGNYKQAFVEFTSASAAYLGGIAGGAIGAPTGAGAVVTAGIGAYGGAWVGREVGEFLVDQYDRFSGKYHWTCPKDYEDYKNANRDGKYRIVDPLVLDLDGDGIETVGAQGYAGALFDHDKDGIRTATGWVSADDGLLVVDRNSDGLINNGSELFGDSTVLKDGSTAAHGYAALKEFDTNSDGLIDKQDADFAKLRVWRDLNQDGISQEGELFTLESLNIQSLNTFYQDTNTRLGNGNSLAQKGSYTLSDGQTREMGDLLLAADHLHSRYSDSVKLTEEQMQAANLKGIGRLRDLREAAALSPKLAEVLAAYSKAETKTDQQALLDTLVGEWAKTDPRYGGNIVFAAPYIKTASEGVALTPAQEREMLSKVYIPSKEYLDMVDQTWHKIAALDAFLGEKSNIIYVSSDRDIAKFFQVANKAYDTLGQNIYKALLFQTRLKPYLKEIGFTIENNEFKLDYSKVLAKFNEIHAKDPQKAFVDLGEFIAYSKQGADLGGLSGLFAEYFYKASEAGNLEKYTEALGKDALDIQKGTEQNDSLSSKKSLNHLSGGAGDDSLSGQSNIDILDGGSGNDTLSAGGGNDVLIGGAGNDRLSGYSGGDTYIFAKGHGTDRISDFANGTKEADTIRFTDITLAETKFREEGSNLVLSGYNDTDSVTVENFFNSGSYEIEKFEFKDQTVTLEEFRKNGMTFTGTDNDEIIGSWSGKSIVYAGKGNDSITTYDADDILDGGEGNDTLSAGGGNDVLIGGAGNDRLSGYSGGDTYIFAKGHGADRITDFANGTKEADTIRFTDITLAETKFRKEGSNLVLSGYNDTDSVTVENFFNSGSYEIEKFEFKDQTVTLEEFRKNGMTFTGTDNDEIIGSWSGKSIVYAGKGNDSITTYDADDILDGGEGNDTLSAGGGNDVLIGGAGNDRLSGYSGGDTYIFAKGHGTDRITDFANGTKEADTIRFTDITLAETKFRKEGSNLVLSGYNGTDSVTVENFFDSGSYEIEKFEFKDQQAFKPDLLKYLNSADGSINAVAAFEDVASVGVI
ncbi:calcium-binding protein [Neisseria wadsworthii]|uniref:calcium-binding protein n=1 Tax=Neisseria wadsworthii TaxID=607711 RepID=UPI000D304AB0|nr:calcium-binding protein [Neisseria wadsworthii]